MTAPDPSAPQGAAPPLPDPPGFTEAMAHALAAALETEQVVALWRERDRLRDEELPRLRAALTQAHRAMCEAREILCGRTFDAGSDYATALLFLDAGIAAADQALRTAGPEEIAR
jgi:hypothetical protein